MSPRLLAFSVVLAALSLIDCHEGDPRGASVTEHPIVGAWVSSEHPGRVFFHPSFYLDDSELPLAPLIGLDAGPGYQWDRDASAMDNVTITFVDRQGFAPSVQATAEFAPHDDGVALRFPGDASVVLERADYVVYTPDTDGGGAGDGS